jgi:hypothetical protein
LNTETCKGGGFPPGYKEDLYWRQEMVPRKGIPLQSYATLGSRGSRGSLVLLRGGAVLDGRRSPERGADESGRRVPLKEENSDLSPPLYLPADSDLLSPLDESPLYPPLDSDLLSPLDESPLYPPLDSDLLSPLDESPL